MLINKKDVTISQTLHLSNPSFSSKSHYGGITWSDFSIAATQSLLLMCYRCGRQVGWKIPSLIWASEYLPEVCYLIGWWKRAGSFAGTGAWCSFLYLLYFYDVLRDVHFYIFSPFLSPVVWQLPTRTGEGYRMLLSRHAKPADRMYSNCRFMPHQDGGITHSKPQSAPFCMHETPLIGWRRYLTVERESKSRLHPWEHPATDGCGIAMGQMLSAAPLGA